MNHDSPGTGEAGKSPSGLLEPRDRILLVEDFEDTVKIIKRLLERTGFQVETALTISEAREKMESMIPDAIILDINLPDGSGLDFLQDLRRIHQDTPVIMLTAYTELENAVRSLQQGVDDFIPKPFENSYLIHSIVKAVEKRRLKERLRNSEKFRALGEMAAGVAHDFNNLLHSMATHIYLLTKKVGEDSESLEHISALKTAVDDATEIVKRLNSMGKSDESDLRITDLAALINDTLVMTKPKWYHRPRQNGRKIDLNVSVDRDIYVRVNPSEIREVFTNLIYNAVDAMPTGGMLSIEAVRKADRVSCIFRDSGIGISPDIMNRIFDPFFTTKGSGSGLGLSISYAIIEKHGGELSVKSKPGEGTAFYITLPVLDEISGGS